MEARAVPVVGPGISRTLRSKQGDSIFPSWTEFFERAILRLEQENKDVGMLRTTLAQDVPERKRAEQAASAARIARIGLIGNIWSEFLDAQFYPPDARIDAQSMNLIRSIWDYGSNVVLT